MWSDKKVLHIIDTLWLGGAQTVLKGLFENNQKQKNQFLFALRNTSEKITIKHPNVQIFSSRFKLTFFRPLLQILKIIEDENIEIIHCHLPKSQYLGLFVKFLKPNLKLVFQEQGDIIENRPINLKAYSYGKNKLDVVIACSQEVKRQIIAKSNFPKEKIAVVYNYVNLKPIDLKNKNFGEKLNIAFAGRIIERKGWKEYIQALSLLKNENIDYHAHIAGVGSDVKKLHQLIQKLNLNKQITHHGFVKNMSDFFDNIDILIVPSHWEPVGMVHLEAMSRGVIVIASDVAGMNEILFNNENCILVERKNPVSIKNAIIKLNKDENLKQRIRISAFETAKKFDLNYFENELNNIYQKIN